MLSSTTPVHSGTTWFRPDRDREVDVKARSMKEASANADEVTELELGAKDIKRLPAGLRKLTKLQKLDLAGNPSLTQFPAWVAELEELRELKWSGGSLPEQVSLLPGLRRLERQGELGDAG